MYHPHRSANRWQAITECQVKGQKNLALSDKNSWGMNEPRQLDTQLISLAGHLSIQRTDHAAQLVEIYAL